MNEGMQRLCLSAVRDPEERDESGKGGSGGDAVEARENKCVKSGAAISFHKSPDYCVWYSMMVEKKINSSHS